MMKFEYDNSATKALVVLSGSFKILRKYNTIQISRTLIFSNLPISRFKSRLTLLRKL